MFQHYGQDLVSVTTTLIMHKELRKRFNRCYLAKSKDADIDNVYKELCNTRLNEFLDSQRQMMAASKGLSGQNFRDSLLLQHIN